MVSSIASSPSVDLSRLPAPLVIDQPGYEARLAAKLARFQGVMEAAGLEYSALLESDPAMKLLEADAYDETVLAQAFADAARGLLLAFAAGAALDQLAALYDVARLVVTPADEEAGTPAVMESDSGLRARVQLAPHAFSVAGPELAYVYHARSAHADVADATAISPAPGEVVVTVLSATGDGMPSPEVLDAVDTALQGPVRPLTDMVTVQAPTLVGYEIEAALTVFAGPDSALILATAQTSLDAYLANARKLGWDISPSAIIAALHVGNVQRVDLASPAAPVTIAPDELAHPATVAVTIAGTIV